MDEIDNEDIIEEEEYNNIDDACSSEYDNTLVELDNKKTRVDDSERTTHPYITKYELIRVLSERTQQLADGAPPFINNYKKYTTAYDIAVQEYNEGKLPFIIMRNSPMGEKYETWKLYELSH